METLWEGKVRHGKTACRRLPKIWESSGPPISYGDTATCHGVLMLG
jgi:hypothetical protein